MKAVAGIVVLLVLALAAVVCSELGCSTSEPTYSTAKIVGKSYAPRHTQLTMICGPKGQVTPIITTIPERWYVSVSLGGNVIAVQCSSDIYADAHEGESTKVKTSRFLGVKHYDIVKLER